jgi:ATP-dependent DNA ligase
MERFLPMLAVQSQPFDSAEHLFEVKWDGVRAVAAVEAGHWNVWGRELADYTQRYPELDPLRRLPSGTVLDGELVLLRSGRADLQELMRRHQLVGARKIQEASRRLPATYMIFDLVYHGGRPLWGRPLAERRLFLAELLDQYPGHGLVLSEGVAGSGRTFFDKVVEQGHEGVMAKHLQSRYLPGRRVQAWRKIKPFQSIPCVVIGYTPSCEGIHSLLVAATSQGVLGYVAELTSGFSQEQRWQLARLVQTRQRPRPVVPCGRKRANWVEPEIFCQVRFLEWTPHGRLRGAHFRGLLDQ